MNSIHRVGVTIAGFATIATVAGAFVVQGYTAAQHAAQSTAQAPAAVAPTADPTETLGPQTIYVNPVPTPQVIHSTPAPGPAGRPPVVHVVVPGFGGDDDGGSGD